MEQHIEPLTEKEKDWVNKQLNAAQLFVAAFAPEYADQPLSLDGLDCAWTAWMATNETDPQLVNGTINVVGVAFGQFLVNGGILKWVIATDEQGSDLAVYGLPGKGDVLVYPANFVAKRWERRESEFLKRSFEQIEQTTRRVQSANATSATQPNRKPWWRLW